MAPTSTHPHIAATADGWTVHPTGTYPADLDNVQWAVSHVRPGGTVLLKSVDEADDRRCFHFGDDVSGRGTVRCTVDVVIAGETAPATALLPNGLFPNGESPDPALPPNRTIVYGGKRPFHCEAANPSATTLAVRHLYFAYPSLAAVQVKKTAGLEVSDCVIYGITADTADLGFRVAMGIEATGLGQKTPAPELRGEFRVVDNIVKRMEDLAYEQADTGIALQRATMTARIQGNEVSNFGFAGIGIDANAGNATIKGNTVTRCGYGNRMGGGFAESCGIGVKRADAGFKVHVTENMIACGADPTTPALISKNGITLCGASGVSVHGNTLTGTAASAGILITSVQSGADSTGNTITNNRMTGLVAGRAQEIIERRCDDNKSKHNDFGGVDVGSGVAGVIVHSARNQLDNEQFAVSYPGITGTPKIPCVWLASDSSSNHVSALKWAAGPPAFDLCSQIQNDGASNHIAGYSVCAHVDVAEIERKEKQFCLTHGGTWSEATHSCSFATQ